VIDALQRRISIRKFLPRSVPRTLLLELLDAARWSPSGGNLQPWKVIAVAGADREAIMALARTASAQPGGAAEEGDDPVYPPKLWDPYRARRFKVGEDMYALLGIARADRERRLQQVAANFAFFGAPVGLFFVIDRRMGRGQWAHLGMFMQSLALVAVERGLGTCMQEYWATLRASLHRHFELPDTDLIYCGMALGFPDPDAAVNHLRSERAPAEEFTTLLGFEG
jgi:nitroreductase